MTEAFLKKWPRQYAAEIIAEPVRDKRRAMLDQVPPDFRDLVKTHVENHFERSRHHRR